jgi:N-acetylmuramoyl-L-alanine amidase-like protein
VTYAFVAAYHDYGIRKGPVKAFVVHMAEGGGTVGYLSRDAARGVSVHYVIEYSGRIVQMLLETHASGSIDPTKLRTTEGPEPYGATVRRQVMGEWDSNPNAAVISLEMEGFAAAGPNDEQRAALLRLVSDVRSRYPAMGLLGHRDFADYKACPGGKIPWTILGGHGTGGQMLPIKTDGLFDVALTVGDQLYDLDYAPLTTVSVAQTATGYFNSGTGWLCVRVVIGGTPQAVLVKTSAVTFAARAVAAPTSAAYDVVVGGKPVGAVTLP